MKKHEITACGKSGLGSQAGRSGMVAAGADVLVQGQADFSKFRRKIMKNRAKTG
ncbi:hypothetical protein [Anaerobiospirillum sp. NML120511]|uniref:hypothetical protein n=1 Tax=Anaerobiospirillum sp. NML120511 TaxID=2932819 RepID=UPI001FF2370C|nr:hypothetical protein [Anaerobiospirillum sp. NML120511]MCK0534076.1 hypothetical protein [Anaerobiospirillum sp. NML120511]